MVAHSEGVLESTYEVLLTEFGVIQNLGSGASLQHFFNLSQSLKACARGMSADPSTTEIWGQVLLCNISSIYPKA